MTKPFLSLITVTPLTPALSLWERELARSR